jgi:hypothetical protein
LLLRQQGRRACERGHLGDRRQQPLLARVTAAGRQASCLRGDPELIADYVLWLRAQNPEPDLVLVHDADGPPHPFVAGTTHGQIIAVL